MASDTVPSRYDEAVESLYSPLHQARSPEALKQAAARRLDTIADMQEYMRRIGLPSFSFPHVIHITGTKGKGSTACMCEAILRERYNLQTGLFTSPHLVDIRERIRINGKPVSKPVFSQAYWCIRKRLEEYKSTTSDLPVLPGFFRIMTLLALHIFSHYQPSLDVIILEVGMGGRYDATNILDMDGRNVVCGVTLLDLDHTRVLGDFITQIAWEKGGIFQMKKGSTDNVSDRPTSNDYVYASSSTSVETKNDDTKRKFFALDTNTVEGIAVLRHCAQVEGQGQTLYLISEGLSLPANLKLGLQGDHQRINAELAVALCQALVAEMNITNDGGTPALYHALEHSSWPGRCQTVTLQTNDETPFYLYLDGAHTPKALKACLKWYSSVGTNGNGVYRALIFNCSHERNPVELLHQLVSFQPLFDAVYFCRADFERPSMVGKPTAQELLKSHDLESEATTWQETLAQIWTYLETAAATTKPAMVIPTCNVGEAIRQIQNVMLVRKERIEVLATGSLYVVGSVLETVEWKEDEASGSLSI